MSRSIVCVVIALGFCGCGTDITELFISVDTDQLAIPTTIDGVRIAVRLRSGGPLQEAVARNLGEPGALRPPFEVGVLPPPDMPDAEIYIEVHGSLGGRPDFERVVNTNFVPDSVRILRIEFTPNCMNLCGEPDDMTCVDGLCVLDTIDATTLPEL